MSLRRTTIVVSTREVVYSSPIKPSRSLALLMRRHKARCRGRLYMLLLPCVVGILRMQVCAAVIWRRRAADAPNLPSKHDHPIHNLCAVLVEIWGSEVRQAW